MISQAAPAQGGGVLVYSTSVELFATGKYQRTGTLAFASSTQQLFIRVDNGWKEIMVDFRFLEKTKVNFSLERTTPLSNTGLLRLVVLFEESVFKGYAQFLITTCLIQL